MAEYSDIIFFVVTFVTIAVVLWDMHNNKDE